MLQLFKKFPVFYGKRVHHRVPTKTPLFLALDHINLEDVLPFYNFKIDLKIISLSSLIYSKRSPSLNFPHQHPVTMPLLPHTCHISSPSYAFCHIHNRINNAHSEWGRLFTYCNDALFLCVLLCRSGPCCIVLCCVGVCCRVQAKGFLRADPTSIKAHETYKCTYSHRINPESLGARGPNSKMLQNLAWFVNRYKQHHFDFRIYEDTV